MHILIADDDPTSRALMSGILEKSGHIPMVASDGLAAWEAIHKTPAPRLAILDWIMPGLDGMELLRRTRTLPVDAVPHIIMLTTKGKKSDIVAALNAGADDYLIKPCDAGELSARIEVGQRMIAMRDALAAKVGELRQALDQIKTLRGILPICAKCKKIRNDRGYWEQVEVYVHKHSEADFSHSICPDCMRKLYPDFAAEMEKGGPGKQA